MKSRIISILLLLVVVTAFSGVASAASHQELVSEAWDEIILVSAAIPGYIIPAIDEVSHMETVIDEEAYDITVTDVEAWDEIIPAVYEDVTVVDVEAQDAYDEAMTKDFNTGTAAYNWIRSLVNSGKIDSTWDAYTTQHREGCKWVYTVHWTEHHPAIEEVSHIEQILVSESYTIHHDAITHIETVPAVTHEEKIIDVVGVPEIVVPEIPAVYETIHHDAVYKTVEDVDPVVPVVDPVEVVSDVPEEISESSIPMQETGTGLGAILLAFTAIFGGIAITGIRRRE